ncbi:MAG: trypsin-like peptidase domain-containing protein [Bdellovibrionaceae bacterium]|nr:trypsin-like peptidase domain-containing protein [Pseudobdellovibrionaceae bacterium]
MTRTVLLFTLLGGFVAVNAAAQNSARNLSCYQEMQALMQSKTTLKAALDFESAPLCAQQMTRSVATLVPKKNLKKNDLGGNYSIQAPTFGKAHDLCAGELHAGNKVLSACSGVLISENRVLTTGRCLKEFHEKSPDLKALCDNFYVVFDYFIGASDLAPKQVYTCRTIPLVDYNTRVLTQDLALIELDRLVQDREPVRIAKKEVTIGQSLLMSSSPSGLPVSVSTGAIQENLRDSRGRLYHRAMLQSYYGNVGAPVFHPETAELVGLVKEAAVPGDDSVPRKKVGNCYKIKDYIEARKKNGRLEGDVIIPTVSISPAFFEAVKVRAPASFNRPAAPVPAGR